MTGSHLILVLLIAVCATVVSGQVDLLFDNFIKAAINKHRETIDPLKVDEVATRIDRALFKGEVTCC